MVLNANISLHAVPPPADEGHRPPRGQEGVFLPPSCRLDQFVATAAAVGLEAPEAVRMGLERALALVDTAPFGLDVETSRRILGRAASRARPRHALTPRQAAKLRRLGMQRPVPAVNADEGLAIALPDRLLIRAAGQVPARALRASVVPEMVRWEMAATIDGRTMGEWALRTLALAPARR